MRCLLAALLACPSIAFSDEPLPMPREVRVDALGDRLPDGVVARLGTTRLRHYGADVLTFDSSGKKFITTGSGDGVRVWDAATGVLIDRWNLPRESGDALCFSADGRTAVIHGKEHIEIWDLPNNRLVQRLPLGDAPSISAACLSNDGRWLASADYTPREHRLRLWDLKTGSNRVVGAHETWVKQVNLSSDGLMLYSHPVQDGTLSGRDLAKSKEAWTYLSGVVWGMTLSGNGARLLVNELDRYSDRGIAIVLDAGTGKKLSKPLHIEHFDTKTAISFDGSLIAVHNDGKLAIHETIGHKKLHEWRVNAAALAFHPDGSALYIVESPGVLQAYSLRTGKPLLPLAADAGHTSAIRTIAWSPDGKQVATSGANGDDHVRIWNAADGKLIHRLPNLHRPAAGLEFSRDGRFLWTCGHRAPLMKWDVATGKEVKKWFVVHDDDYEKPYGQILATRMLSDGVRVRMFLVGNEERERPFVATFDLESGKFEREKAVVLPFHLLDQAHLLDNRLSCAGQIFNPATGEELPPLDDPNEEDQWVHTRLSADTRLVAAARWQTPADRARGPITADAVIFERISGRQLFALPKGPAGKYAFSSDGRHFAVAAPDGIHIWDIAARREIRFIKGRDRFDAYSLDSFATAIAYSPDGKRIATGHADTTILIWDAALQPGPKVEPLSKEELERCWDDLAQHDPSNGLTAVVALQDRPEQAWKLLGERLKPVTEPADVREQIARLDDNNFRVREAAHKQLADYGEAAKSALQAAAKGKLSEEQKKHVSKLLEELDPRKPPRGNDLRGLRCLMILEKLNTAESRRLIERLAKGLESARLTREAKEVVERSR
jgi:WD40 repeat protein